VYYCPVYVHAHGLELSPRNLNWGCVEYVRCRLFLLMFVASACLSRGPTRLHCAITAEQIEILFGVNTLGVPRNIVLDGGPDPSPTTRGREFDAAFVKFIWLLVVIQ